MSVGVKNITTDEIMVYIASHSFKDEKVALVGTGLPMIAAFLAKLTHAPNCKLIFESGVMDSRSRHMATGVGDFPLVSRAVKTSSLFDSLSLLQRGNIDLGFLGAAEIDPYGNINSTVIGDYKSPKVRLPGSGGANDIASLAKRVVIMVKHQKRKFKEKLHYVTTPGFLEGPQSREKYGLQGQGPERVITDLGVFAFDNQSKRMKIESLHPGVTLEQVKENTGFELGGIEETIPTTELPSEDILQKIRSLDPNGIYINKF
jgi:glutaconate CoA-transferase subunit B